MRLHWPRRSAGLPPGQRRLREMPRFSDNPFRPPPAPAPLHLTISIDREPVAVLTSADLDHFEPRRFEADFHCVTTWSIQALVWTGVPLHEIATSFGLDERSAPYLVARGVDHRRGNFVTGDALAPDVLLATHLDGVALGARHGGPLRLVAPQQYGYKSIKHLISLDFSSVPPRKLGKEHLRARVALEERHPSLPAWLVRTPYRLLIAPTALVAERSLERSDAVGAPCPPGPPPASM